MSNRTNTFKDLDIVAVDQQEFGVHGPKDKNQRWRVGMITHVDDTTGHVSYSGSYIGPDGKLTNDNFSTYGDDSLQRVEFANVEFTVKVPSKWQSQLIESEPKSVKPNVLNESPPETHPSYGVAALSRISGNAKLFMSPFRHQHFIGLKISRAERYRSLSDDHTFSRGGLIEVFFSESQWARMLSSVAVGEGTPCTINRVGGDSMPECPENDERSKFQAEVEKAANEAAENVNKCIQRLQVLMDKPTVSKKERQEVMSALVKAQRELSDSLPFVISQFTERMETVTDEAKTEIQAFIDNTFRNAGIEKLLESGTAPISLTDGKP